MTVIRPNSVSGITSITAQANEINFFRSNGALAGLQLNGVNFNTTTGVSTFNNLDVGGVLTYQDVTNVDSVGIITARSTIDAQGDVSIADKIIHTGDTNTALRFPTADTIAAETGGTERLRIGSTGLISIGDNTNLDSQLTITQAQGDCIRLRTNTTNNSFKYGIIKQEPYNNNALGLQIIGGKSDSGYSEISIGGGIDGGYAATQIDFYTGSTATTATGTKRVRIDSSGRLMINQTTNIAGTAKLEVMGTGDNSYPMYSYAIGVCDTQAYNVSNGTGMGIGFSYKHNSAGATALGCGIRGFKENTTDGNYAGAMAFYTRANGAGATERLRIMSDGRVLIGTNSTHNTNSYSNNLIIYENGDTGLSILGNNSNSNYASLYLSDTSTSSRAYLEAALGANGNFTIGKNGTGRIRYNVNGSEKFCMTHTGRFGVGDTDPDFAVHIKSNVPAICFEDTDGTHGQAIIEQNGDELKIRQDAGNASSGTGSTILFQVDASTKMRIDGTGYVGINRTSPAHYLDVDGTSLFRNRVFIATGLSMKSTPFGANVTYDTGISVNGGGYGGSILAICSKNFGAGTNTQSGVYLLKFHYDGNTGPTVTLIAGSNLATFGKSGSNTLTVFMGASNNMFTAIESSVVNA